MDDLRNYGRRDYSKCDYERRFKPDLDFDDESEETEDVKEFGSFLNITFYVTNGPIFTGRINKYVSDLLKNGITSVVRTNPSRYTSDKLDDAGLKWVDIDFPEKWGRPEEGSLSDFHELIKHAFLKNKKVSIAIQGYEEAPFVIAFALMVMGLGSEEALEKVREFDGEASYDQQFFLSEQEDRLKVEYERLLARRNTGGIFGGVIDFCLGRTRI